MMIKEKGVYVFDLVTQVLPGANASLDYLEQSLDLMAHICDTFGIKQVNMPQIGCGIGGLEWDSVYDVLELVDAELTVNVFYLGS